MSDQVSTLRLEIPGEVPQQDVWDLETALQQVDGVSTDLQESRSFITAAILIIGIATSIAAPITTLGDGVKTIAEVAKLLYTFIHRPTVEKAAKQTPHTLVIITKKGNRVSVTDLSVSEIEELLKDR
jgi:hypothetical protein